MAEVILREIYPTNPERCNGFPRFAVIVVAGVVDKRSLNLALECIKLEAQRKHQAHISYWRDLDRQLIFALRIK